MKRLIIVESPSKAKTIQKYLSDMGGEVAVLASKGHICDLPQRTLGIDIEHHFKPEYVVAPDKADTIKKLTQAVKKYDEVYLATDPDREGEAISWHLKNTLGIEENNVRIEFHEITKKAVVKAMEQPREINMDLVDSQQARRVLDRLVGYKISPILAKKVRGGASAGRVQSVALKMIVEREREIKAFVPEEYWNIFATLKKPGMKGKLFKAAFADIDGKKVKVTDTEQAQAVIEALKTADYAVDNVKKGTSASKPAPPFTTSTLQQESSYKLNMTADRSIRVAQQLYEGINVEGEGLTALITYIRTDSVRVSPDFALETLKFIASNYGKEYAPAKQNFYKTKANAQDAHEAIRPISLERTPKSLEGKIDRDQLRLYKLIYERYLASQMKDALYNVMNVHIVGEQGGKAYGFTLKGKSVLFKGYTAVYSVTVESDEDDDTIATLPDLDAGEKLKLEKLDHEQKFTKPPARYSDATIVKAMEENGIGRPSTYASIISVLAKREYTSKDGKNILPTALGIAVCEYMEKYFEDIMNLTFTARMEGALDKIADGGQQWYELIESFYPILAKRILVAAKSSGTEKVPDEESDVVCEKCGAKMVIKDGKYGKFLACPNYPKCKNIKKIIVSVGKCPKCGGDITKKFTKTGKAFYGCASYPNCDFLSWDLPAPYFCPECGSTMRITTKSGEKTYICTSKTCNHKEIVE
ncbi:MAG TPA: type I DNA topoisomerase [Clostridia bacterium]|nr:type I DNA topoisomerase [Clostridia bacterium]